MLTIEILRVIWWALLGILFMGYAIMDGFDLGAATLFPLVTRTDLERRVVLNTIGPFWEGNQVWIILGAGAIFAAWPYVYSVAFSGAYFAVLLLLLTMGISRPVSFKYRSKLPNMFWRRFWDWVVFIGGCLPSLIFGILIGNILQGLPYTMDTTLRSEYLGTLIQLFNPFALFCGLTSLMMLAMHGGIYLAIKTNDPIRGRAIYWARIAAILLIILFAIGGLWIANGIMGYQVSGEIDHFGYSNPLHKAVITEVGAWMHNYALYPLTIVMPVLGFLGAIAAILFMAHSPRLAFICSSISEIGIIGTVGVSMFPFILPSSTNLSASLLVWDASSTQLTLMVMLFSTIIFLPLILIYTSWVYYALRGKVNEEMIEQHDHQKY